MALNDIIDITDPLLGSTSVEVRFWIWSETVDTNSVSERVHTGIDALSVPNSVMGKRVYQNQRSLSIPDNDPEVPPYYWNKFLGLISDIENAAPENKLSQTAKMLVFLVSELDIFFDEKKHWEESKSKWIQSETNRREEETKKFSLFRKKTIPTESVEEAASRKYKEYFAAFKNRHLSEFMKYAGMENESGIGKSMRIDGNRYFPPISARRKALFERRFSFHYGQYLQLKTQYLRLKRVDEKAKRRATQAWLHDVIDTIESEFDGDFSWFIGTWKELEAYDKTHVYA